MQGCKYTFCTFEFRVIWSVFINFVLIQLKSDFGKFAYEIEMYSSNAKV